MPKSQNRDLSEERISLEREISTLESEKISLEEQINKYKKDLENYRAEIENTVNERMKLEKQIDDIKKQRPSIEFEDLANNLKRALASVQTTVTRKHGPEEAVEMPAGSEYIVDKFEVEIKSGIDLSQGVKLVQPAINELTPEALSTVRISFKSKPEFEIVKEQDSQ